MSVIFPMKKDIMELQKEVEYKSWGRESWGWVIVLSSENNDLEFPLLAVITLEKYLVLVLVMEFL